MKRYRSRGRPSPWDWVGLPSEESDTISDRTWTFFSLAWTLRWDLGYNLAHTPYMLLGDDGEQQLFTTKHLSTFGTCITDPETPSRRFGSETRHSTRKNHVSVESLRIGLLSHICDWWFKRLINQDRTWSSKSMYSDTATNPSRKSARG